MSAPSRAAQAPVSALDCRAYRVPTDQPEADGTLAWTSTVAVVVEVSAAGAVGTGWTYASAACRTLIEEELAEVVLGGEALEITGLHEQMVRRCRNLGRPGIVSCAISAVDIALWDLKARLLGLPLANLFGRYREAVPVYGSGGFTTYDEATFGRQLTGWMEQGITAMKLKIGESWGSKVARDLSRVAFARSVIGDRELYVDANGGYSRKQAVRVGRRIVEEHDVVWFEEPVSSDDLEGLREVRDQLTCDVAAGEYGYDEPYFARMLAAGAVDCLQIDVTRCGGYTSFLRAAALAAAHGLAVSAHCAPGLHAPVAVGLPNLRHIEYFHDHARLEALLFEGTLAVVDGTLTPDASVAGHGMALRGDDEFRLG
ncbi:MAG TPA: enolase C-terminal domain-like protein [Acidimicrobiales bacterium]|nr:enolase C-terminal domain-like protein [Acidimicrobiales bacterium]